MPWLAKNPNVDVILTAYNFTMEPFMNSVIEEAEKAGKGIVAMKVMAGGMRRVPPTNPNYARLTREGALLSALKWVLSNPGVAHDRAVSMTDMDQLDENLKAMAEAFSDTDREDCWRCTCSRSGRCTAACAASATASAGKGLPVADVLRFLTYADGYGQFGLGAGAIPGARRRRTRRSSAPIVPAARCSARTA